MAKAAGFDEHVCQGRQTRTPTPQTPRPRSAARVQPAKSNFLSVIAAYTMYDIYFTISTFLLTRALSPALAWI